MIPLPGFTTQDPVPAQQLQQGPSGFQLMQVPAMPTLHSQQFFAQQPPQMQQVLTTQLGAGGPGSGLLLPGQMVVASQAQQGHCSPQQAPQQQQQPVSVGVLTNMLQGTALQL